jgi:long-chain fatty acid transport protein
MASTAAAALLATIGSASAGGFMIREQSAEFQGMSFAGNAAGGALSAMFWNSAAAASREGMNTESSSSVIFADSQVTVTDYDTSAFGAGAGLAAASFAAASPNSGDIGPAAFVPSSYGSYQVSKNIYLGMAVNAPFGLETDPNNYNYQGSVIAQKTELLTYNFNPTVAVRVMPGVVVGVGAQIQMADGNFRFATATPSNVPALDPVAGLTGSTTKVEGNGWGFGGTAGVMIDATPTTKIGVGYRSQIDQEIEGHIETEGIGLVQKTDATLHLPDMVTVSVRQEISPVLRLNGTFEWTNWSRFKSLAVTATEDGASALGAATAGTQIASLPFNWSDGYFVAAGAEYDLNAAATARFGAAYEWSPVDSPEKRSTGIPDSNRTWVSAGLSVDVTASMTIDLAYSHLFVEDARFERVSLSGVEVEGDVKSHIDIISVGLKTKW